MSVSLLLACAGKGSRAGYQKNKLLYNIDGTATVLEKTLACFYQSGLIDQYVVVVAKDDYEEIKGILPKEATLVIGGDTRTQSVKNGLKKVSGDIVLIHDGARPFVSKKVIEDCIECVKEYKSAIPVIPSHNTACKVVGGEIVDYLGKDEVFQIQTPQGFYSKDILKAYDKIGDKTFNDDGEVYKNLFGDARAFIGDAKNIKLTYKEDFINLDYKKDVRVGVGFDCHRLVENRKLILGGIEIEHDKGLLGHSDADVLTHAIMDAMLSSVAKRDIGYHFPDSDEKYKGARSTDLLKEVIKICNGEGYKIKSLSAVIMAEKPKLLKHIPTITKNLADILELPISAVGIGATTLEGLGFIGREEGVCVRASAVLEKI